MSGYIKQDGIEIINILNKDGEQTLSTTGDQGIVVSGSSIFNNDLQINDGNNYVKISEGSASIGQIELHDSTSVFLQGYGSDFRVAVNGADDNWALKINTSKHTDLYGNLTINKNTPVITLGVVNSSTGNSKIQFYSKNNNAANGYALQYNKDTNIDRLEFIDGSGNANIKFINGGAIEMISNKAISWGSGGSIRAEGNTLKLVATTLIDLQDNTQIQGTLDVTGTTTFSGDATYHKIQSYYDGDYTSGFKFSDYNGGIWYDAGADDLTLNAGHANSKVLLNSGNALALTLDASQNAIFAGSITFPESIKATNSNLKFHAGGNHILNIDVNGKIYPSNDNAKDLGFSDSAYRFRNLYMSGTGDIPSIYLHDYIYHKGDTDTYMRYQDNMITFSAGGAILMQMGRFPQSGGTYSASHAFASNGLIAPNLGGANMIKKGTDVAEAGIREEVEFMDGTKVQAHTSTGNGTSTSCYHWYHSEFVKVDAQKDYEFSVWIKSTGDDHVYLGWHEAKTNGGNISSNPYFHTNKIKTYANNNNTSTVATNINGWTLLKFKLKSHRTSSSQNDTEGTDRYATNNRNQPTGVSGVTGVMHSTTSHVRLRLGSCYGSVNGSKTWFYNPKITEAQDNDYIHDLNAGEWSADNLSLTGNLTFTNGADILMPDNSGAAVEFKQGTDLYMRFITTNGGEHIEVNKNIELQGVTSNTINVNTGQSVYFSGTNGLRLLHDGTDGHVITGTGDLKITNGAQDKDIIFRGNDAGSSFTAMYLDMSDAGHAHFNSTVETPEVQIRGANTSTGVTTSSDIGLKLFNTSNTDGNFQSIDFFNSSGFITARIGAQFDDAGDRDTDLYFCTRPNGGSLQERMRINKDGSVGITGFLTVGGVSSTISSATAGYFQTNTAIPANQIVHVRDNVATTSTSSAGGIKISSSPGNDVFLLKRWDHSGSASYFSLRNNSNTEHLKVNMANGYTTINGNTTINGDTATPHSDNAFSVNRGSDGSVALRVQNTGEVVTQANYFYAAAGGTSMYVQNTAVFRGAILNDGSNAPVRIADDLRVEGDILLPSVGHDLHLGDGLATTPKIRFGSSSWNNDIGLESYWMVLGCNQNEGFKFRSSNGTMLMQINGNNNALTASDSMEAGPTSVVFPNVVVTKNKSYDYDATPPNQNLLDIGSIKIAGRNDIYGNAAKTEISPYVARYVNDNTGATTVRTYVDDGILVDGDNYMVSVYYENLIGTLSLDWCDNSVTGNGSATGTSSAPKSGRIYGYRSRSDYNSTYRFFDINLTQGSGHEVTLHSPKVEAGTILTDFVALERDDIDTNSKHIKDLIVTNKAYIERVDTGLELWSGIQASKIETNGNDFILTANSTSTNVSPSFVFKSSVSGGSLNEKLRITSSGELKIAGGKAYVDNDDFILMSGGTNGTYIDIDDANTGVGILKTSPEYALDVNGTIRATGDVIAYSDERVKENIKTIDNSLDKVNKLRGVEFNKIGEEEKSIGVIAQEIEKIVPEVVRTDGKGMKSVAYGNLTGLLIEAIKDLKQEIQELKKQVNDGGTK